METTAAYNALLGRDWIHPNFCIPSTLHQLLVFWKGDDEVEVVTADNKPFVAKVNTVDVLLYEDHIGPVKMFGLSKYGRPENFTFEKSEFLALEGCYKIDRTSEESPIPKQVNSFPD